MIYMSILINHVNPVKLTQNYPPHKIYFCMVGNKDLSSATFSFGIQATIHGLIKKEKVNGLYKSKTVHHHYLSLNRRHSYHVFAACQGAAGKPPSRGRTKTVGGR